MSYNGDDMWTIHGTGTTIVEKNPYIEKAAEFARSSATDGLVRAQVYATLAVAWELGRRG